MPTTKELRAAAAKQAAETRKAHKLHAIAERRAKAAKMSKAEYIAAIVRGKYAPISQEDIANEPNPEPAPEPAKP
jgi:hypothetical protein